MPVKVKICGLTNLDDVRVTIDAGADLLGFILYPKSPRYCPPEQIASILRALELDARPARPLTVGVFVNATAAAVQSILDQTGLDLGQLHGDEPPAALHALAGCSFKALRTRPDAPILEQVNTYHVESPVNTPQLLLDAYTPDAYGGTGARADWATAAQVARIVPRLLLAGGLTPDTVAEAIAAVAPWGVDVSSGVEAAPGCKDPAKVRDFIAHARQALPTSPH